MRTQGTTRRLALGALGALVAMVTVGATVPALTPAPAGAAETKRLAFASELDGDMDIYVTTAAGAGRTNLTPASPGVDTHPAWAGSQRIAFASDRDGDMDVYVMAADGTGVQQITDSPGYDGRPSWSPDGRKLAFASDRSGGREIHVVSLEVAGRPVVKLTTAGKNVEPAWKTGNRIAFTSDRDGDREVFVMDADGTDQHQVTYNDVDDGHARWVSASRLLYQSKVGGDFELVEIDADGTDRIPFTTNTVADQQPSRSPTGGHTAFIRGDGAARELYVSTNGGPAARLTYDGAKDELPDWGHEPIVFRPRQRITNVEVGPGGTRAWVSYDTRIATEDSHVELWRGNVLRWQFDQGSTPIKHHVLMVNGLLPETNYTLKIMAPKPTGGEVVYTHPFTVRTLIRRVAITGQHADVIDDGDAGACGDLNVGMFAGNAAVHWGNVYDEVCDGGWNPTDKLLAADHVTGDQLSVQVNATDDDFYFGCAVFDDCEDRAVGTTVIGVVSPSFDYEEFNGSAAFHVWPTDGSLHLVWHFTYQVTYHN